MKCFSEVVFRKPPKVRILLPYFGKWPKYLPLYLDGCRRNPDFEFLFITDCPHVDASENVRFVEFTLQEVKALAEEALSITIALDRPFKLCDLRPAFGLIFKDYLEDCDFWGWGDIDCVYGNLARYASHETLASIDVFSCRKEYLSGVFTLIRNSKEMNYLFQESPDWKRAFSASTYFAFDECSMLWHNLIFGKSYAECRREVVSFSEIVRSAIEDKRIRGFFETVAAEDAYADVMVNERGVFLNWSGWMLLHFVVMKNRWYFCFPNWSQIPESYIVSRLGFWKANEWTRMTRFVRLNWPTALGQFIQKARRRLRRSERVER
jgi:hypothetical protein